ncbi:MAG TPA: hypothetical protein VF796_13365 [Humisphaera sp.]
MPKLIVSEVVVAVAAVEKVPVTGTRAFPPARLATKVLVPQVPAVVPRPAVVEFVSQ